MALKENEPISLCLSQPQPSPRQGGFSKVALNTQIVDSTHHYLFLFILITMMVLAMAVSFCEIKSIIGILPVIIIAILTLFLVYSQSILSRFHLYFIDADIDMVYVPVPLPDKKNNHIFVATRILHPKFTAPKQHNDVFTWLNSWELQGLKINVLRVILRQYFADTNYLSKLAISINLHRKQFIFYCILLFCTVLFSYNVNYNMSPEHKVFGFIFWGGGGYVPQFGVIKIK